MKRICQALLVAGACWGSSPAWTAEKPARPEVEKQRLFLRELEQVLPLSESWTQWVQDSGELPPDFDRLPSVPFLPDPLTFADGPQASLNTWFKRRRELLSLFQYYVLGTYPPSPGEVRVFSSRSKQESGAKRDEVVLEFGPEFGAKLRVEIILPRGQPPYPVFVTAQDHRDWALVAVSRGYMACVYAGGDTLDDTSAWTTVWPKLDWTRPTRRAWAASRCVDYLQTLPLVDTNRIALAGHGPNARTTLIASAFDTRIKAVIASSSGAGGACPFRLFSEAHFGQGIETLTRTRPEDWHPRLRFFSGREHKLPVDQSGLIACIAPRSCLLATALHDPGESVWAIEQSYYSARRAYDLHERGHELNLLYRPDGIETRTGDMESFLDWLDTVFERGFFPFPGVTMYPTYDIWQRIYPDAVDPKTFATNTTDTLLQLDDGTAIVTQVQWALKREEIRQRIQWNLGEAPPYAEAAPHPASTGMTNSATAAPAMTGRSGMMEGLEKRALNFGNAIAGDLYYPTNAMKSGVKMPAAIWVHPISVASGYAPAFGRGEIPPVAMARNGFAVLAFDQIGNGSRLEEVQYFYHRYPLWSLLGKQVEDTLAAVEALLKLDTIDPRRIYLVGFGSGAWTALHACALDTRVTGVVAVGNLVPMRWSPKDAGAKGLEAWTRWLPLQPRLGAFVGFENRIPYDYQEVLAMIAPRPILLVAPQLGRSTNQTALAQCVESAGTVFERLGARDNLQLLEINDLNRFAPEVQKVIYGRMRLAAGLVPEPGAAPGGKTKQP